MSRVQNCVSAILVPTDYAAVCYYPDVNSMNIAFVQYLGLHKIIN